MHQSLPLRAAALAAALPFSIALHAAPVTWQAPFNLTNVSGISTGGTLVRAVNGTTDANAPVYIDIGPAGVSIKGPIVTIKGDPLVNVNSGSPSPAGSGSGASPKKPKNAKKAVDSKGGTDKPITQKAAALIAARAASTPFCEICNA